GGIAAHWTYKEGGGLQMRDQERFNWLKQLIEWAQEVRNPHQFLETVHESLFTDQLFCFTPMGDLRVLPKGATPIDFAYDIHTEVGHRCTGARVNNRLVPLSSPLRSGDLVEIVTSKTARPRRDWLTFVVTARAQNKIRQFFQAEERAHAVEIGKQLLEKELRRRGIPHRKVIDGGDDQQKVLSALKLGSSEEMFREIGLEKLRASEVAEVLSPGAAVVAEPEPEREPNRLAAFFKRRPEGIAVDGVEDMLLHLAKCCNPIPGDDIVAFVTRGRGVTVHSRQCDAVREAEPDRLLTAHWVRDMQGLFDVPVQVTCLDEPGVLARVTKEIGDRKANIASISTRALGDGRTVVRLVIQVEDQGRLDSILKALRRVRAVVQVERLRQAPKAAEGA
ncbi:MAG: bifunctional (p)ppGpp synthetase/guanosine-3',5'-bis(diphosphate) 3'-pyrophosphohydrolase, partial [Deltaproteobacteria bacterium]|nr:bifunctional (p)ppGpp synthetase/guanosine-3',5'-bis(diphosphate) 3'-pyrophosphohydrolase [Deltaproteobacteria bacterium]